MKRLVVMLLVFAALGFSVACARQVAPLPDADARVVPTRPTNVKVAAIQMMSQFGQPEANRQHAAALVRKAAGEGAKIVVLPEAAITGYSSYDLRQTWALDGWPLTWGMEGVSPAGVAEAVPGPSTEFFGKLAHELGIYLTVPFVEVDAKTRRYFNTIVLVGPDGSRLLHYRKLNPWPWCEKSWATPGDRGLQYLDTPYGRLGLLVCYDINFEPPHLAAAGVDTLLYCIAWVDRPHSTWFVRELPAIARKNRINIIGANWTVPAKQDWPGYGKTLILDATGTALARIKQDVGEEIIYAELLVPEPAAP